MTLLALPLLFAPLVGAAGSAEARQIYSIVWSTPVVQTGPCLLSVVLPPSEKERCSSWTRRETAGPAFHDGLGVVVVGGSDRLLHGLDARDGHTLWVHQTPGAVVAKPTLVEDGAYVGTDDARVLRFDVSSGRQRWETPVDAEVTEPVVVKDDVVFGEVSDSVAVTFNSFGRATAEALVATGEGSGSCGGYESENRGAQLIERVDGNLHAVLGFPLLRVLALLRVHCPTEAGLL